MCILVHSLRNNNGQILNKSSLQALHKSSLLALYKSLRLTLHKSSLLTLPKSLLLALHKSSLLRPFAAACSLLHNHYCVQTSSAEVCSDTQKMKIIYNRYIIRSLAKKIFFYQY